MFDLYVPFSLHLTSTYHNTSVLGIEGHPAGWTEGASVTVRVWALPDTTFVTGFNAVLNVSFVNLWLPVAELMEPRSFTPSSVMLLFRPTLQT